MPERVLQGSYVVTGGAQGLGAAVVDAIAQAGGEPTAFDIKPPAHAHSFAQVDVSDTGALTAATDDVARRHRGLSGVVACAGIDACGPIDAVPFEAWERVIRVNLIAAAALVRAALPHFPHDGSGRIVTVASTLGLRALGDASAYCASKCGVVGLTRALAAELRGRVGVTCLIPGGMATGFFDGRPEQYRPPPDAQLNAPADVANAAIFALAQPRGCEVRELLICPSLESSWP
ncbi:MAG: SDR family oxidoreductase [Candidatus Eremiobacteraeota bacterium]|nr:SDR family oxidoreductase [Candidatus Eremiobacteraeota bacterium]